MINIIANLLSVIVGASIGYFISIRKEKKTYLNEQKIDQASEFLSVAHESLKFLNSNLNIEKAQQNKFELIKATEKAGLLFDDSTYKLLSEFTDKYALAIQYYIDENQTGKSHLDKPDLKFFTKKLKEIRKRLKEKSE